MKAITKGQPQSHNQVALNHGFLSVHADIDVLMTLVQHLQLEVEDLPHIYNLAEAMTAVISRIGYMNQHTAHLVSPGVLDAPDAGTWMPTLALPKGES